MGRQEVHSVDMKQLNALLTVADTGSVTRAAQLLHLVQSAVTRQIQSLEDQLGVALFERTRTGMLLTDAGSRLVHSARHRSEERRVGKECRSRWSAGHLKKKGRAEIEVGVKEGEVGAGKGEVAGVRGCASA